MTAPRICDNCGCTLDAGEVCDCAAREVEVAPTEQSAKEDSGSMEFEMLTDMESFPKTIDFNFEALKAGLAERLDVYKGLVVTEDGIKAAKEDRAKLNKLREALESKRKEVKKECMAPYTGFEAKVKELVALIDQPIAAIDGQLKGYEERRRDEKRKAVQGIYEEVMGELCTVCPLERLWRDTWYNTSMSLKKIRETLVDTRQRVTLDMEVLATVDTEFAEAVKLKYLETLDLSAAFAERTRLQAQAERLREYESREKNKQAAQEGREATQEAVDKQDEEVYSPAPKAEDSPANGAEERVYLLRFECQVTRDQARELSVWLRERNIKYRRI